MLGAYEPETRFVAQDLAMVRHNGKQACGKRTKPVMPEREKRRKRQKKGEKGDLTQLKAPEISCQTVE